MSRFEDFVLIQDDFFGADTCQYMIEIFKRYQSMGMTETRLQQSGDPGHYKNDDQFYLSNAIDHVEELDLKGLEPFKMFVNRFWEYAYPTYTSKYSIVSQLSNHSIRLMKMQETQVGGGYHVWHSEDDSPENMRRIMTYILYLNDVEEGGETEFLYYPKRIKPQTGRLILWPAGYTHAHRGNPPLSNVKYILTGWVEFT